MSLETVSQLIKERDAFREHLRQAHLRNDELFRRNTEMYQSVLDLKKAILEVAEQNVQLKEKLAEYARKLETAELQLAGYRNAASSCPECEECRP